MVALARARAIMVSGLIVSCSVRFPLTVEDELGEDESTGGAGDEDLALGARSRAKGFAIWFVWTLNMASCNRVRRVSAF